MRNKLMAAALLLAIPLVHAEPGERWEMKIEMDGTPMPMPMQSICAPKRDGEPPVTRDDSRCKMLDKKQSGNRFQWKVACPEGVSEGDVTTTPDGYHGTVKTVENGGRTTTMKMAGRKLGPCDYQDTSVRMQEMMKQRGGKPGQMPQGMPELTPEMKAQIEAMQKQYGKR